MNAFLKTIFIFASIIFSTTVRSQPVVKFESQIWQYSQAQVALKNELLQIESENIVQLAAPEMLIETGKTASIEISKIAHLQNGKINLCFEVSESGDQFISQFMLQSGHAEEPLSSFSPVSKLDEWVTLSLSIGDNIFLAKIRGKKFQSMQSAQDSVLLSK